MEIEPLETTKDNLNRQITRAVKEIKIQHTKRMSGPQKKI